MVGRGNQKLKYSKVGGNTSTYVNRFTQKHHPVIGANDILPLGASLNKRGRWKTVPNQLREAGYTERKPSHCHIWNCCVTEGSLWSQRNSRLGHASGRARDQERWFTSECGDLIRITGGIEPERKRSIGVRREGHLRFDKEYTPKAKKRSFLKEEYRYPSSELLSEDLLSPVAPSREIGIAFENPLTGYIENELISAEWHIIPDSDSP